jgi:hypothetical protein
MTHYMGNSEMAHFSLAAELLLLQKNWLHLLNSAPGLALSWAWSLIFLHLYSK